MSPAKPANSATGNAADDTQIAARIVRCPACGGDSVYAQSNPYRPFCCAACKGIDLGAWASEQYRVPDKSPVPDGDVQAPTGRQLDD